MGVTNSGDFKVVHIKDIYRSNNHVEVLLYTTELGCLRMKDSGM